MDKSVQKKKSVTLPVVMAIIPAALTVLEMTGILLMTFGGNGGRTLPGIFAIGVLAVLGLFSLPFFCLIFEIVGLVSAIRRKSKVMIVILSVELAVTVLAAACAVIFFKFAVNA